MKKYKITYSWLVQQRQDTQETIKVNATWHKARTDSVLEGVAVYVNIKNWNSLADNRGEVRRTASRNEPEGEGSDRTGGEGAGVPELFYQPAPWAHSLPACPSSPWHVGKIKVQTNKQTSDTHTDAELSPRICKYVCGHLRWEARWWPYKYMSSKCTCI